MDNIEYVENLKKRILNISPNASNEEIKRLHKEAKDVLKSEKYTENEKKF